MATGGLKNTELLSDETFDILCSVCKTKNKNTEAAKFCVDCQDYYCSTCVKFHEDVPALSRHKILDSVQFKSGTSHVQKTVPTERCDRHSHKHVDMYCQNHDVIGCSTCMAVDHKLCVSTFYIPDFLRNNITTSESKAIGVKLETTTNLLGNLFEIFQREKTRQRRSKDSCLETIKEIREDINQRLDELEENSVKAVEAKYKAKLDNIDENLDMIQKTKKRVSNVKDDLASTGSNLSQAFVNTKKGKHIAKHAMQYVDRATSEIKKEHDIQFKRNSELTSVLEALNILGHLEELKVKNHSDNSSSNEDKVGTVDQSTQKRVERQVVNTTQVVDTFPLIEVNKKKVYNVKIKSDKRTCSISSACILDDKTVILADSHNSKLKRVDSSTYTVKDYCGLTGPLYQVRKISNHEVAVSCGDDKYIQFVSVGDKMAPIIQMKTDHICYGLAYAAGHLYISDCTTIYVYTESGSRLQQFSKDQSGQELFYNISSLAVSDNGSRIYVADHRNGLSAIDKNGNVVGKFSRSGFRGASSICTTDKESAVVCWSVSKKVSQFTADCKMIGEVLNEDGFCCSVCYDHAHSKVLTANLLQDTINVYNFCLETLLL